MKWAPLGDGRELVGAAGAGGEDEGDQEAMDLIDGDRSRVSEPLSDPEEELEADVVGVVDGKGAPSDRPAVGEPEVDPECDVAGVVDSKVPGASEGMADPEVEADADTVVAVDAVAPGGNEPVGDPLVVAEADTVDEVY